VPLPFGSDGEIVQNAEEQLREQGFETGEFDGRLDEETRQAIADYQLENELEAHGELDRTTLEHLGVDTADLGEEVPEPPEERTQFKQLVSQNPNYFGNLPDADLEAVEPLESDTSYEELTCVGYQPELERIEGVVHVKRDVGYGGGICSSGTPEYVRFYVDWNNDGSWHDIGVTSFRAYDVPSDGALEYGVSMEVDPDEQFCAEPHLPRVRAILSWNRRPPAGTPNFTPVWGNVLDSRIQIEPLSTFPVGDLPEMFDVQLPEQLTAGLDLSQTLSLDPQSTALPDLVDQYRETSVPAHRFVFPQLSGLATEGTAIDEVDTDTLVEQIEELDIDTEEAIQGLLEEQGDTYYEELNCVGLSRDGLNATFTVKRPTGYLGGLCSDGSHEHVAFWEWDPDTSQWTHLGTTSVGVHDISNLPGDGLVYGAFLPADLRHRQQPCEEGASLVRVRATLSWEKKPPASDPYWTPRWGESMETLVHVPPGPELDDGVPQFGTIGSMTPCQIEQPSGMATGQAQGSPDFTARESPFGRTVTIHGRIVSPASFPQTKYRVLVRPYTSSGSKPWRPVQNAFSLRVYQGLTEMDVEQTTDPDGFYTYQQDLPQRWVPNGKLAEWPTHDKEGRWEIKLEAKEAGGPVVSTPTVTCPDGTTRDTVIVNLDNTQPEANITIDEIEHPDGTREQADACGDFTAGVTIHGTYTGTDEHFQDLSIGVTNPENVSNPPSPSPSSESYPSVQTGTRNGSWKLDTTGLPACGYTVHIDVDDRTIVNSGHVGFDTHDSVSFCLSEPPEADGGTAVTASTGTVTSGELTEVGGDSGIEVTEAQFDAPGDDHENLNEEYVTFTNTGDEPADLTGCRVEDDAGHTYEFPDGFALDPDASVTLYTGSGDDTQTELYWGSERAIWDNTGDSVVVYDPDGNLLARRSY
jgi:peptidoglycan hydrolase-like protein with peptidoglycan-binding domain